MKIRWLPQAQDDLKRLYAFIELHSKPAAGRAIRALTEAAGQLQDFPQKGRPSPIEPHFREFIVNFGARGYVMRYRIYEDQVVIVRIWHTLEERSS